MTIHVTVLRDPSIPLAARYLRISFPCSDDLWYARNEVEWTELLSSWSPDEMLNFSTAVHAFLSGDLGNHFSELQSKSPFVQHIILCGISETIEWTLRLPYNYEYVDDWIWGSLSSHSSRTRAMKTLKTWHDLYVVSADQRSQRLWDPVEDIAKPRTETILLYKLAINKLTEVDVSIDNSCARLGVGSAVEVLNQFAMVGFARVSSSGFRFDVC